MAEQENLSGINEKELVWHEVVRRSMNRGLEAALHNGQEVDIDFYESVYFRCFMKTLIHGLNSGHREHAEIVLTDYPELEKVTEKQCMKCIMDNMRSDCKNVWPNLTPKKETENADWGVNLNWNWKLIHSMQETEKSDTMSILRKLNDAGFNEFAQHIFIATNAVDTQYDPKEKKLAPPAQTNKPCMLLDMDETLIHAEVVPIDDADFEKSILFQGKETKIWVRVRPYCHHFLQECSKHYEIGVFTASLPGYADPILNEIDPEHNIKFRLYREHCTPNPDSCFVKDLRRIGRDLKKLVLVDNSVIALSFQLENGIPIYPFYEGKSDVELLELIPFLEKLSKENDFTKHLEQHYKMNKLKEMIQDTKAKQKK
jgi:Dullard-like phosphatase family protein